MTVLCVELLFCVGGMIRRIVKADSADISICIVGGVQRSR